MTHLRLSGLPFEQQREHLASILLADTLVSEALHRAHVLDLPDWWIVSGALYNTVWNHLTGKPSGYGIKDVDLFYFDASDLSWEAEDVVIRKGAELFAGLSHPVEIRNQARVHLWFEEHFGQRREPLVSSAVSLGHFAAKTHSVGVRLDAAGRMEVCAPFGLDDIFSLRMVPNRVLDNRATYETKSARSKAMWPELAVEPW
ncbi:nucleotidyltransferase family protein [Pseudaminobacter soli (ex Li et al. 2025)]|uniref:Nucleotidyltransferase family protein n=1 Tax=Pseudaminobacter soli (ex Li et al. 2025) TaxID=1295366 RepID=A0A2P7SI79_9HYPH|nr:nucleotidyltransferase family protein [Mesorhizobium soli]PSJ62188.1 hypothetical protein C7I85_07665 [Mesorhizobium soli]